MVVATVSLATANLLDAGLVPLCVLAIGGVVVRGNKLWIDFWYRDLRPPRCREPTGLDDTPGNRKKVQAHLDEIRAQIRRGTFEYAAHFPRSNRLNELEERGEDVVTNKTLLGRYMVSWLAARSPLRADNSVVEDAEIHPTTWLHDKGVVHRHIAPQLGALTLSEITPGVVIDFRRSLERELRDQRGRLVRKPLRAKTVNNVLSVLRTALEEAVGRGLIERNPVISYRRRRKKLRTDPQPLSDEEVEAFLAALPAGIRMRDGAHVDHATLHDLYAVWFLTGWRPNEIAALRFEWLSFRTQMAQIRAGRSPRRSGLEADPKTGQREVDCSYAPAIFEAFERRRRASIETGRRDYVFTDSDGRPISQEWLHKRVWRPTLRLIGVAERGSYAARDTFITTAIDAGERPSWVAQVCGTSEQMIWQHYKGSLARREDGSLVGAALSRAVTGRLSQPTVTARKRRREFNEL